MRVAPPCFAIVFLTALACVGQTPTPEPVIKVVDADTSGVIKLTTSQASSSFRLPLEVDAGEVANLTLTIDDFVAANGSRVRPEVTLDGKAPSQPVNVTMKDRPIVELTGSFPVAGEYKSHLVLFYSGKRKNWSLVVVRQKVDLTVQIDGVETAAATKFCKGDAMVRFIVRETSGQKTALYSPTLEGIALKEGDKVRKQARYDRITLDGVQEAASLHPNQSESYVVEPLSTRSSTFRISGIEDAGEYIGTVRLSGSNGNPVTKEVTLLVKSHVLVALFWISLGVLASYLIRRYTKEERPKLQALRRLGHAEDDLMAIVKEAGNAVSPPALDVFSELARQLSTIRRSVEERTAPNNGVDSLNEMEAKIRALPEWLTTGRRLDAVAPPEIVESARAEWQSLGRSYFSKVGAPGDIVPLLSKIEEKISDSVKERIEEFAKKVSDYKAAHAKAALKIDQEVALELDRAKANAKADTWQVMTDHFRAARLAFAKVLAGEMNEIVTSPKPPLGFEAKAWADLRNTITEKLRLIQNETDPDRVEKTYHEANRIYFDAVVAGLKQVTEALAANPQGSAESEQFKSAAASLTSATLAVQKEDWAVAKTEYEKAAALVAGVLADRVKRGGAQQSAGGAQTAAKLGDAIPPGAAVVPVTKLTSIQRREESNPEWLTEKIAQYDLLLNLALLVLACVVGLSLLWVNDPVWGGWKAYTTALLWGLGLHQVGGSSLDGLSTITKKVTEA